MVDSGSVSGDHESWAWRRAFESSAMVVVVGQFLALSALVLALGASIQSGSGILLPVAVLAVPAAYFGYRRTGLLPLVVSTPLLVLYSQVLWGYAFGGPGGLAARVVVYLFVGLTLAVVPFALGYATSVGVERAGALRATR